jgi:hypothetical protein
MGPTKASDGVRSPPVTITGNPSREPEALWKRSAILMEFVTTVIRGPSRSTLASS